MSRFIATCFYIGYLPLMPGTWGSIAAFPVMILAWTLGGAAGFLIAGLLITVAGFYSVSFIKEHDPPEIIIDEVVGQWSASALVFILIGPPWWGWFLLSFLLFRLFDILKPWPINRAEKLPGALGIMADDILAGIMAGGVLWLAHLFWMGASA